MNTFIEKHSDKIITISECGCMIWMGSTTVGGYGQAFCGNISDAGNKIPEGAHRASYAAEHGEIAEGVSILHRCDIRPCVNPDHLFDGTQDANMKDMAAKGRSCLGSRHGMAKMTEADVLRIRSEYKFRCVTASVLAEKYGFSEGAVASAIRRTTWKHI